MTPDEYRRRAAAKRLEAARAIEDAKATALHLITSADLDDRTADEMERLERKSPTVRRAQVDAKIGAMDVQPVRSRGAAVAAAKAKSLWPLRRALTRRNLSVPEWAKIHGYKVEVVKSWLKAPESGGRRIPRPIAEAVEREFVADDGKSEVPAVAASWPAGIKD